VWELIGGCFAGIVTVGVLWKMFDMVFAQINEKLSIAAWNEHCKRIDQLLDTGNREFQRTREALQKQSDTLEMVNRTVAGIKATLENKK
jgi:hypothetical protein